MNNQLLIVGYVWPEPKSSAAGRRMMQLIEFFKSNQYKICFATPCAKSDNAYPLDKIGVDTVSIEVNSSSFNNFVKDLNPNVVLFDRFMMEEQFGWRVQEVCPKAITILDTEDLHALRKKRRSEVFGNPTSKNNELELRELASIYRCDLTLIISKFEIEHLKEKGIPEFQLLYLPFMEDAPIEKDFVEFENRAHFITIGTFLHEPNLDGVRYIKEHVWPLIRKRLPEAEMHVYGSYSSQKVDQLHNIKDGFLIKGWAENAEEVMRNAKVCLSPLRFGAGLKGKFIDAMKCGTPAVTTKIGAEGMPQEDAWPGFIKESPNEIANKAILLYTDESVWQEKQDLCFAAINDNFSKIKFHQEFNSVLFNLNSTLEQHRSKNTIGNILKLNTLRSTKFMSKWIEEKNKPKD